MGKTISVEFDKYIADDIAKYAGVAMPVKAGFLNRILVRKALCTNLHANPDDEFSIPSVGPSYRIISEYERKYVYNSNHGTNYFEGEDPIMVEKIRPDGYMILNGHHRWAAALKQGYPKIPVQVINVTHNQEIKDIIKNSKHDKRVTLDLDEVVFSHPENGPAEKDLPFPLNRLYKDKLRLGIPALFNMLNKDGYDIWVYSSKFYSKEYIRALFKRYHVHVTGIVTGTSKRKQTEEEKNEMQNLYAQKYIFTLHIDNDAVLMIDNVRKDFQDFAIDEEINWSKSVMDIIKEIDA
jgi:hypothetical protein